MKAPLWIETSRLLLRTPTVADAETIFSRYACDAEVTRYLSWPQHRSVEDTRAFLQFSDSEWERWPAGPYLIELREGGALIGGTGLAFETAFRASTGYVLAKDGWGKGYATEALLAMVGLAPSLGVRRLYSMCHPDHRASWHVLEKCGFERESLMRRHSEFANLQPGEPLDTLCYVRLFD